MREKAPEIEDAMALASVVLPTPGMSVKSTWPPAKSAIRHSSTTRSLPTMTCIPKPAVARRPPGSLQDS